MRGKQDANHHYSQSDPCGLRSVGSRGPRILRRSWDLLSRRRLRFDCQRQTGRASCRLDQRSRRVLQARDFRSESPWIHPQDRRGQRPRSDRLLLERDPPPLVVRSASCSPIRRTSQEPSIRSERSALADSVHGRALDEITWILRKQSSSQPCHVPCSRRCCRRSSWREAIR